MFERKKKYYFLVGLPRAGNTLLGSILNQNKRIAVTANSPVPAILYGIEEFMDEDDKLKNFQDRHSLENITKNIIPNYYSDWKARYIIDRAPWGTPANMELIDKYCPNEIKIIVLVRNLYEVLASYLRWAELNPGNFLDVYETREERCEHLMVKDGIVMMSLYSIHQLLNNPCCLFIKYDNLVLNTKDEINNIYEFLDIPSYNHSYDNLKQFECNSIKYNDDILGANLHHVKSEITKSDYDFMDYVPPSILEKYADLNSYYFQLINN